MIIDCDSCQVRPLACGDCVVSYVLGPMPWAAGDGMVDEERAALAVLADSGLLPPLRLVPRSGDLQVEGSADGQNEGHRTGEKSGRSGRAVS